MYACMEGYMDGKVIFADIITSSLVMCMQAWFLDQFGVLHDGKQPYPGAISTCTISSVRFVIRAISSSRL